MSNSSAAAEQDAEVILCETANEQLVQAEENDELTPAVFATALESFEKCITLNPNFLEAYLGKAYVCGQLGKFDEALAALDVAQTIHPNDEGIQAMKQLLNELIEEPEIDDDDDDENDLYLDTPPPSTLIQGDSMTPQFHQVLEQVFERFDVNKDGALDKSELNTFHLTVNGEPLKDASFQVLTENLECNSSGALTLNGFKNFYHLQTLSDSNETLKDLKALGFDSDLIPIK